MKTSKEISVWKVITATYKTFVTAIPRSYFVMVLLSLAPALVSPVRVYLESAIFDRAGQLVATPGPDGQILRCFTVFALVQLLYVVVYPLFRANVNYTGSAFETVLQDRMNAKTAKIPLIDHEKSALHSDIELATSASRELRFMTMMFTSEVLLYAFQFLSVSGVLLAFHPSLVALAFLAILPDIFARFLNARRQLALLDRTAPIARRKKYFAGLLATPATLKEDRVLHSGAFLVQKWADECGQYNQERAAVVRRNARTDLLCRLVDLLTVALTYGLIVLLILRGSISIGQFGAALGAVSTLKMNFGRVCDLFLFSLECGQKGKHYYRVLAHRESEGRRDLAVAPDAGIRLRDVCFAYPEGRPVLQDVSFSIRPGETVAIVGENGAGKTTLVKLLLGLYRPDSGSICYGGQDLAAVHEDVVFAQNTAVFQDYTRYAMTLLENVALSDTRTPPDAVRAAQLLRQVGFAAGDLPLDGMLGRTFGGDEPSGGNWQKLAIARGLYRPHQLIALDEPTAAIDPLTEDEILHSIATLDGDKTKVIVTHRLNTTRFADRILVLDQGRVAGFDTHEALLATNAIYAKLWQAQAHWYQTPAPDNA